MTNNREDRRPGSLNMRKQENKNPKFEKAITDLEQILILPDSA